MDTNQNSDLQSAINGIMDTAAAGASPADDIQSTFGIPPTPEVGTTPEGLPDLMNPAPEQITKDTPVEPVAEAAPVEAAAEPVADLPADGDILAPVEAAEPVVEAASVEAAPAVGDTSVKAEIMRDLFPLMDKVQVEPEQKFDIYREMLDTTKDSTMVADAYAAAKNIADETKKAEALLYLLKKA